MATYGETGSIEIIQIQTTGEYEITAIGANGGNADQNGSAPATGGAGAEVQGTFHLTAGDTIEILVGGAGENVINPPGDAGGGAGGGGGTFVYDVTTGTLLEAAGGGGGASDYYASGTAANGVDGQAGTNGTAGNSVIVAPWAPGSGGAGGSAGSGGGGGIGVNNGSNVSGGGGGAGYGGNGGVTGDAPNGSGDPILTPAQSLQSGGGGGTYPGDGANGVDNGGFGGGGASDEFDGGGGGGYSGGGGGGYAAGGGGGSYVDASATGASEQSGANTGATAAADSGNGVVTITEVSCFCAGTRFATESGAVAVEDLRIGDRLRTADGAIKSVVWIGRRVVSARFADPTRCWPVRVKAGALAETVPCRDLLLSPEHALLVGDVLIQAGALVNGSSIVRVTEVPETFVYYHVELDDHALVLAENAPAETFVDTADRRGFDNWAEHEALFADGKPIDEMPYPRAKARRQVPLSIRAALDKRAAEIGAAGLSAAA